MRISRNSSRRIAFIHSECGWTAEDSGEPEEERKRSPSGTRGGYDEVPVAAMQASLLAGNSSSVHNSQNNTTGSGSSVSVLNRSQQAIMDSISIVPLTQSQFECRKTVSPLPTFNGQPTRYFYFIAAYKDSALKCGFSATENLQRISDALQPPARNTVKHLLCRPNKLSKVLSLLEDNFGRPELMVRYAEDLARKIHSLREN